MQNSFRMTRAPLLAVVFALAGVGTSYPRDGRPGFVDDLLHVSIPIHKESEWVFNSKDEPPEKETLAPRAPLRSSVLPAPVFDVSDYLRKNGVIMPRGSQALFSPGKELLFIRASADNVALSRTLFSPMPRDWGAQYTLNLQVSVKKPEKARERVLNVVSAPMVSGQQVKFGVEGKTPVQIILEPIVGPDGDEVDLVAEVVVGTAEDGVTMSNMLKTRISKVSEIVLEKPGFAVVTLRLQMHRETAYWGPLPLATPAKKAEAVKEISQALRRRQ